MRKFLARLPMDKLLLGAVPVALLAGTWLVALATVDHLLYQEAVTTGRDWTAYLAENVRDLAEIAKGAKPNADSQRFLDRARKAGEVFRSVIYDPEGHTRFVLDDPGKSDDDDDDEDLAEHNPAAARAIAQGEPLVEAEEGEPPQRPAFFSEAYLPVVANGKTIAIVETYVDQAEKRDEYRRTLVAMSAALLALIAIAFGAPALAWVRRTNEKQVAEAHIQFLAHHDSLTGLLNRNRLTEEAATILAGLSRSSGLAALHCLDVDHFKNVNDTLGHDVGDALIVAIAARLKDLAPAPHRIARLGGDEFVVMQAGAADEAAVVAFAAEIRRRLSASYNLDGHVVSATISIGVAIAPAHGDAIDRLMKNADLALDHSKSNGRDATSVFSAVMDEELAERLRIERAIRAAVADESFELYYQPAVEMPEGRLVAFEALLRMRDENGAMVSPAVFIPLAEQMSLIDRIGEWVLREACHTARGWPADLKVAVNLSPAQFVREGLSARIAQILSESGLEAGRLELEITEGLLLKQSDDVMAELRDLKALGVSIVMDDFGTGYSSLSYLWQFPFDKIKIDRAFMRALDAEDHGNAETIVRTIIDLGRSLNVTVTVEGVENDRQAAFVREAGCNQIQGFYFGRPMPAVDLAAHILKASRVGYVSSADRPPKAGAVAASG
jgi:diguanylate cyclase (GGDEF)-like protein